VDLESVPQKDKAALAGRPAGAGYTAAKNQQTANRGGGQAPPRQQGGTKKMLQNPIKKFAQSIRQKRIAAKVRNGIVPRGVSQGDIMAALKATKPYGVLEMFGFLRMRIRRYATGKWEDYGVVSVKKVTAAFANYVVDSLQDSTTYPLDAFTWHDAGDDNTAESNAHTALQNSRESRVNDASPGENGANVYQSVATITATAAYTVEEHGIFSANAAGTMLDRNLVPNAPSVIANDSVEFTYELTVNAEA
jgi:hypothetical protein